MLVTFDLHEDLVLAIAKKKVDINSILRVALLVDRPKKTKGAADNRDVEDFLLTIIPYPGMVKAADAQAAADMTGIPRRALDRAKKQLGVKSIKQGFGAGAIWYWGF